MIRPVALAMVAVGLICLARGVLGADALLIVQRPNEPEGVRHRYSMMEACRMDLAGERNLNREPPGTRLTCKPAADTKEAKR